MKEQQQAGTMRLHSANDRAISAWAIQLAALVVLCLLALPAQAERVRDLASFAGVRDNQLVRYGLVVGLDNSGDQTTQAPFTSQSLNLG